MRTTRRRTAAGLRLAVAGAAYLGLYRRWAARAGATADEVVAGMPGDEIVPRPLLTATNGVTVRARPEHVWPWLAQMGAYTRAGWYSFDRFDNAGVRSADRVVPELQDLRVGTRMPTSRDGSGFEVVAVDPPRTLVLVIPSPSGTVSTAMTVTPEGDHACRLVNRTRMRVRLTDPVAVPLLCAMDVGHVLFTRRMLLNIKDRAERLAAAAPGAADPVDHSPTTPLRYDLSVDVRTEPAAVWALLVDVQDWTGDPASDVTMEKLPPGPTRVGTRWRERVRWVPGLWMTVSSRVTALETGRRLVEQFSSAWFVGELTYSIEAVPDGARLRQRQTLRLRGVPAGLAGPVDRALRWRLLRRLADLRDALESERRPGERVPEII
jgi:hypothetical protein